MSESNMSYNSYARSETAESANSGNVACGVQRLHLQNEELTEQNSQLRNQVDSLTKQLKDALSAASAAQNIGEQIKSIKQQISEEKSKKEKLAKELKNANANHIVAEENLNVQIRELQNNLAEEQNKAKELQSYAQKIKKERNLLRTALDDKMEQFDIAGAELKKTESTKKKLKQKTASALESLQAAEEKSQELQSQLEESNTQKKVLEDKLESITLQITSLTAERDEANHNNESLKKEITRCNEAIKELEENASEQEKEIESYAEERPTLINFIEKMHKALALNENAVAKLQEENKELLQKSKSAPMQMQNITSQLAQTNILDLKFPFEGEIADQCAEIMKLQQYTPIQRVQLIINEVAHYVEEKEKETEEATKAAEEKMNEATAALQKDKGYGEILASLLNELKEHAPQTANPDFINFVNEKCNQIDLNSLPQGSLSNFYNMTEEERKNSLERNRLASKENLINGQQKVFDNLKQAQQIQEQECDKEEEQQPEVFDREVPVVEDNYQVSELQAKVQKLKESKKQIHAALKSAQENNSALMITEKEARTQAMKLQTQVDTLKQENDVLKVQLQVAQNDLELRMKEESSQSMQSSSCESLTCNELRQKTEECEKLKSQVQELQEKMTAAVSKCNRRSKAREAALREELETITEALQQKDAESQAFAKKVKKAQKKSLDTYKVKIEELQTELDTTKANYEETVTTLKTRAEEAKTLSEKLVNSLHEYEEKNQKLQDDAANAAKGQKELMSQIISVKQQASKEKQNMRAQLSVQLLAQEAKFQETAAEIRTNAEKKSQDILGIAAETIGAFYGIDVSSFNEEMFAQLAAHVKSDLDKLRFFQNEMIKYNPNN